MTPSQPIRVFLLDDHEVVRRGLRDLLESDGDIEIVGESGTVQEATSRIPALRPDVAVLDVRLPDGDGPRSGGSEVQQGRGAIKRSRLLPGGSEPNSRCKTMPIRRCSIST